MGLARCGYEQKDWELTAWAAERCLRIKERSKTYVSEADAWGAEPYDFLSLGLFYTGRPRQALEAVEQALALAPWNDRLKKNRDLIAAALVQM